MAPATNSERQTKHRKALIEKGWGLKALFMSPKGLELLKSESDRLGLSQVATVEKALELLAADGAPTPQRGKTAKTATKASEPQEKPPRATQEPKGKPRGFSLNGDPIY